MRAAGMDAAEMDAEADEVWDMDWTKLGAAGPGVGPGSGTDAAADVDTNGTAWAIIGGPEFVSSTEGSMRAAGTDEAEMDVEADAVWDMDWTRLGATGPDVGPAPGTDAAAGSGTDATIGTGTSASADAGTGTDGVADALDCTGATPCDVSAD